MKIESTGFSATDVMGFMDELRERDRRELIDRLRRADERLQALRPALVDAESGDQVPGESWSAHEVLAHIAVLSKFYGVVAHQIAAGKVQDFDLLGQVRLRDVAGEAAAAQSAAELLDAMAGDHARTVAMLEKAELAQLYVRAGTGLEGIDMSAADVVRLPLVTHLEAHIEQLEGAVNSRT